MCEFQGIGEASVRYHLAQCDDPRLREKQSGNRARPIEPHQTTLKKALRGGRQFWLTFFAPPRQVLSWKPSATVGNVLKN